MRRTLTIATIAALAALAALAGSLLAAPVLAPAPAHADDDQLVIIGPADLADSGLADALMSAYEASYDGTAIDLHYVSADDAEAVARAADPSSGVGVLLVDDPELESRFVDDGHSAEAAGRAAFWSELVMAGTDYPPLYGPFTHDDLPEALETVAAAGAEGKAQFLSRGGTDDGTVREHALWALTDGVPTCTVSAADGGGASPSTVTGPCPSPIPYPSWYVATGTSQVETLEAADGCVGFASTSCLALGGRGTLVGLREKGSIDRLFTQVVDTDVSRYDLTLDVYHAYAVAGVQDVTAPATEFVEWLTGPAGQRTVETFLARSTPYRPSAATEVSTLLLTPDISLGDEAEICGTLSNPSPRSAPIGAVEVTLLSVEDDYPRPSKVAEVGTTTTRQGAFCFELSPRRTYSYRVTVPVVTTVQDAALGYRDTLQPRARGVNPAEAGTVIVRSRLERVTIRRGRTTFRISGRFVPVPTGATVLAIYAGPADAYDNQMKRVDRIAVRSGTKRFDRSVRLGTGRWKIRVEYRWGGGGLGTAAYRRAFVLH